MLDYQLRLYRRCRDTGFADDDPLLLNVCRAWQSLAHPADVVDDVHGRLPRLYRPPAEPTKTAGLRERELSWGPRQKEAGEAVARQGRMRAGRCAARVAERGVPEAEKAGDNAVMTTGDRNIG